VGCKVTLRKKNLYEFIDTLNLTLPRMEKFKGINGFNLMKNKTNSFSFNLTEIILFYPIELGLGINTDVKKIEINFLFKNLSNEEKIFLLTSNKIPLKK
jgi:large subunit ribosomal protein L5